MSTTRIAVLAASGLVAVAVFQVVLALGAPLGRAAWGGSSAQLSVSLRVGSAVSALVLLGASLIVLGRAGVWAVDGLAGVYRWGTWALVVLIGLSALANFASSSRWESRVAGPLALLIALLCLLVALRADRPDSAARAAGTSVEQPRQRPDG